MSSSENLSVVHPYIPSPLHPSVSLFILLQGWQRVFGYIWPLGGCGRREDGGWWISNKIQRDAELSWQRVNDWQLETCLVTCDSDCVIKWENCYCACIARKYVVGWWVTASLGSSCGYFCGFCIPEVRLERSKSLCWHILKKKKTVPNRSFIAIMLKRWMKWKCL